MTAVPAPDFAPYQRRFLKAIDNPAYRTVAASWPRGCGKTTLAGYVVARALTPGDPLFTAGAENVLFAGSIEQCRLTFRQAMGFLGDRIRDYRIVDSATRVAIQHKESRTRLKAVGSNPKTSLGLVGVPLAILDEPAALHTVGGQALWDSIRTAMGKPGSPLRAILTGTIAPAVDGGWWPNLVHAGSEGSRWVGLLQGRPDKWSHWREILRVNPLARLFPDTAAVLREERDAAMRDSRLEAAFKSFRLNLPSGDESTVLLTAEDWKRLEARTVPSRAGRPVVGLDLGAHRAWSAAVAWWPNGRVEALAIAPGLPAIEAQEKRDRVPAGTYRALVESGRLQVAEGLNVPPAAMLVNRVRAEFGVPLGVVCDRFRLAELRDCPLPCPIDPRVTRWSDSSFDIRALRKAARDGSLAVDPESRPLVLASLTAAMVENDSAGNFRLIKRGTNNQARDDVAAALTLAAGGVARLAPVRETPRIRVCG